MPFRRRSRGRVRSRRRRSFRPRRVGRMRIGFRM